MSSRSVTARVTLRDVHDDGGTRHLETYLTADGDIVFSGQDLGPGVERVFGAREYEWIWTVRRAQVGALARALGTTHEQLLERVAERFAEPRCAEIESFLESHAIPFERWNRIGD